MDEDVAATESREGTWPKRPCIALRALIGARARCQQMKSSPTICSPSLNPSSA